jgi:hypothetical protein
MAPSTGDERAHRQTDAVQREMRLLRAADETEDPDLVETVGEEQRREREAREDDDAEGEGEGDGEGEGEG